MKKTFKQFLIEAKYSKPTYAYHATKLKNLESIIKNGLIPNKEEGGYGSDEINNVVGYSLTSYNGVYFTKDYKDVLFISKHLGDEPVIIIAKIHLSSCEIDEDIIVNKLIPERKIYSEFKEAFDTFNGDDDEYFYAVDNIINEWVNIIIKNIKEKYNLTESNAYISILSESIKKYLESLSEFLLIDNENILRDSKEKLTRIMKKLVKDDSCERFKINSIVGFSGSNKIVGLYSPNERVGWGDLGDLEGSAYHKYNTPIEFLKSLKRDKRYAQKN